MRNCRNRAFNEGSKLARSSFLFPPTSPVYPFFYACNRTYHWMHTNGPIPAGELAEHRCDMLVGAVGSDALPLPASSIQLTHDDPIESPPVAKE
jgi:hypothetical protein